MTIKFTMITATTKAMTMPNTKKTASNTYVHRGDAMGTNTNVL